MRLSSIYLDQIIIKTWGQPFGGHVSYPIERATIVRHGLCSSLYPICQQFLYTQASYRHVEIRKYYRYAADFCDCSTDTVLCLMKLKHGFFLFVTYLGVTGVLCLIHRLCLIAERTVIGHFHFIKLPGTDTVHVANIQCFRRLTMTMILIW